MQAPAANRTCTLCCMHGQGSSTPVSHGVVHPRTAEFCPNAYLPSPIPGNVTVQMLGGEGVQLSSDAQQLKDWVEKGEGCAGGRASWGPTATHTLARRLSLRAHNPRSSQPLRDLKKPRLTRLARLTRPPPPPPPGVVDSIRQRYLKKMYFGIAADPECTNILEASARARLACQRAQSKPLVLSGRTPVCPGPQAICGLLTAACAPTKCFLLPIHVASSGVCVHLCLRP